MSATTNPSRRRHLPLGRETTQGLLRAPPTSYYGGRSWPPSVRAAREALESSSASQRREGGNRGRMRSAFALFTYAGALAARALKDPSRQGDLVEAFSIFVEISESENTFHFARYRAPALYNASVLLQQMPTLSALRLSGRLAMAAMHAIADEAASAAREEMELLAESLAAKAEAQRPASLRWAKTGPIRLIAECSIGRSRIPSLPEQGFRGIYPGIVKALSNYSLVTPQQSPIQTPMLVRPEGTSLLAVAL